MQLAGRTVIVTGASRGIGRALARKLAAKGCGLLLTGLEAEELAVVASDCQSRGARTSAFPCDLASEDGMRNFVDWLREQSPSPDILINNAGGGRFAAFASASWQDVEDTIRLNAIAPTRLLHHVIPILARRPEAVVVNISSAAGRLPYPGLAVYGACKGYLSSLSETLACELAPAHVRVMCLHPGFTSTSFMSSAGMDMRKIPGFFIQAPESIADRVIWMLEKDRTWAFGDPVTRLGTLIAGMLPHRLRVRVFRNLYWRLPQ